MHDLLRTGRYDQILGYSSVLLEKDPQNLHAIKYKAYALYFLGRYDEAILYYNKAIQIEPMSPSNYAGKSKALEKLGRIGEARHCRENSQSKTRAKVLTKSVLAIPGTPSINTC